jgi:hypothetical protein
MANTNEGFSLLCTPPNVQSACFVERQRLFRPNLFETPDDDTDILRCRSGFYIPYRQPFAPCRSVVATLERSTLDTPTVQRADYSPTKTVLTWCFG